jgi:hypothetical protein
MFVVHAAGAVLLEEGLSWNLQSNNHDTLVCLSASILSSNVYFNIHFPSFVS